MQSAVLILSGFSLALALGWCVSFWRRSKSNQRQQDASMVLKRSGLEAYTYLAAFGAPEGDLRDALTAFEHTGKVVIDENGRMVGRLLPKVSAESAGLRLVVDNTKA